MVLQWEAPRKRAKGRHHWNDIYRKVKSGQVVINSPEEFADAVIKFIPKISTGYLPVDRITKEPEGTAGAPSIKGTLKVHMIKGKSENGNACL